MDTLLSKIKLNTILHNFTCFKLFQKSTVVILKTQIRINEKNIYWMDKKQMQTFDLQLEPPKSYH
jgi:hypothetical protein